MKTCNRKILELFYNAKHTGRISKPDAVARVGEDDEGLVIELTWRVIGGVIADAKFRAFANPNAIAITSLMVDNIIGKSVDEAILIGEEIIIDNLGEFRPEYLEAYDVVREAIHEAYNNYQKRQTRNVTTEVQEFDYEQYRATHDLDEDEEIDFIKIQRELQTSETVEIGEKRGRGRPRKPVDPNAVVEVGEKRGRGRPRKEVDLNAIVEVGEKRGRGRPRKERPEVDETIEVVKRGRGRPRKEVDPNAVIEVGEKRGRGRPKKEIKYTFPNDLDEVINDEEIEQLIMGDSARKTEPVKQIETTSILNEDDDIFESNYDLFKSNIRNILSGKEVESKNYKETNTEHVQKISTLKLENDTNTLSVVDEKAEEAEIEDVVITSAQNTEIEIDNTESQTVKRGRGRPRKEVDPNEVVEVEEKRGRGRPRKEVGEEELANEGEKRGRGRPRKIVIEEVEEAEKRGRGRPRLTPINSLTRSLAPTGLASHNTQDIVFASKNVTTTNININVTKTSTSVEGNKATSDDYSHSTTISQQKVEITVPNNKLEDEEIEVEPVKVANTLNSFEDSLDDVEELTFDLSELIYISSAGLRIILSSQKRMNKQGSMKVTNVQDIVMEVFESTGFVDILTIE